MLQQRTSGAPWLPFINPNGSGSLVGVIRWVVDPCKATILQIAKFSLFLCQELGLSVPVVKGYRAALNHVFSLTGLDLAASSAVSWMSRHFKRLCPPREIRPSDWNLSLVFRCLSRPPFEPHKLASDKHLTWKTVFLLALASAKRVSELHGLSFRVRHSCEWNLVPSRSFLTLWLRPRIHQFLTLAVKSSQCHRLKTSLQMIETSCCCVPSVPSGNICPGQNRIIQGFRTCSS